MQQRPVVSIFTIANIITALRILVAPVFFFLLVQDAFWGYAWALILFIGAALTDFVDGILARYFGEISEFGIFLDPLADKILVLSALFGFTWLDVLPLWMVSVVAVRDVIATIIRVWSWSEGKSFSPSPLAKWKTFTQMGFVSAVLVLLAAEASPVRGISHWAAGVVSSGVIEGAMSIVVLLTIGSLLGYLRRIHF
ncbi:MAG: CDP-alcohol phosphatidyltransferase family protein [Bacteroidota bacterium]|nr:CDP-alcohol phosphatidyltransferase family protein [Candidatus Kapabacteria bacterium]MCS7302630.1 CDP-alcohol phosphatidyltransferase family protein [Candidatus Kapabacteria bacterium]MCX7936255.1 CDP-alcohol phosphatidyltransferase family protein [Chlorobiota bacterium]MDW8074464.1 CDP-alcohol phosphatidyltransferase family protein [Bacteroidota bacterium]MDW8271060.1 CDP-alcohol phosphatidyltransferase family protein [Bacteroidota bacterium]